MSNFLKYWNANSKAEIYLETDNSNSMYLIVDHGTEKFKIEFENRKRRISVNNGGTIYAYEMGVYYQKKHLKHEQDYLTQLILMNKKRNVSVFDLLGEWYVEYLIDKELIELLPEIGIVSPPPYKEKRDKLIGWRNRIKKLYNINVDLTKCIERLSDQFSREMPENEKLYSLKDNIFSFPNLKTVLFVDDMISSGRTVREIYGLVNRMAPNAAFYPISLSHPY